MPIVRFLTSMGNGIASAEGWVANTVAFKTKDFVKTLPGRILLSLMFLGPIAFLPTIWQAWTAADIDSLRTMTWPIMITLNMITYIALSPNSDPRPRLVLLLWALSGLLIWIATLVR